MEQSKMVGAEPPVINRRSYAKYLDKAERNVAKRTKTFLKDPDANIVHDLRTSTRRMLAAAQLLPRKMRSKKKVRRRIADYEKLMKLNAPARDLDIILSKIPTQADDPANPRIAKSLTELRGSALKPARRFASSIENEEALSIQARDLTDSALEKRLNKTGRKLFASMEKRLPIVLKDPTQKEELHLLREDSRWLRYTLEPAKGSRILKLLAVLRSWQEILGVIHDSDVFIDYFQDQKEWPEAQVLRSDEMVRRNRSYEEFRAMAGENPISKLADWLA
jgi:CHAD domain-containing protein